MATISEELRGTFDSVTARELVKEYQEDLERCGGYELDPDLLDFFLYMTEKAEEAGY